MNLLASKFGRPFGLVVAALVCCATLPAQSAGPQVVAFDQVVFPSGEFPEDVARLQAAADAGGRVLLKAVNAAGVPTPFDFGPAASGGFVRLRRDVQLIGERTPGAVATLRGGRTPLRAADAPIRVHVEGITFDGPSFHAINFNRLTSAAVVSNRIRGLVGVDVFGDGVTLGTAIGDGCCTESFRIAGNVVEPLLADLGFAIVQCCGAAGSVVEISGNHIAGPYFGAIESAVNEGQVRVAGNLLMNGADGGPLHFGDGIVVLGSGSYRVERNTLISARVGAAGIAVVGLDFFGANQRAVVEHNHLSMHNAFFGIGLSILASQATLANNRLEGSGDFAFGGFSFGDPGSAITGNTFVGNNLSGFGSVVADLFFDTSVRDTVYVGYSGTVIDLGSGNTVTGLTRMGQGAHVGQRVKEAMARRQQALGGRGAGWPSFWRFGLRDVD